MTTPLQQAARRVLAFETGEATTPETIAAGAAKSCEKLSRRLEPLVGAAGATSGNCAISW